MTKKELFFFFKLSIMKRFNKGIVATLWRPRTSLFLQQRCLLSDVTLLKESGARSFREKIRCVQDKISGDTQFCLQGAPKLTQDGVLWGLQMYESREKNISWYCGQLVRVITDWWLKQHISSGKWLRQCITLITKILKELSGPCLCLKTISYFQTGLVWPQHVQT